MRKLAKLNDDRGYDPYNHVGCDMRIEPEPMGDKVFVMSKSMMTALQRDFLDRPMLSDLVKPRHMGGDFRFFGGEVIVTDIVA